MSLSQQQILKYGHILDEWWVPSHKSRKKPVVQRVIMLSPSLHGSTWSVYNLSRCEDLPASPVYKCFITGITGWWYWSSRNNHFILFAGAHVERRRLHRLGTTCSKLANTSCMIDTPHRHRTHVLHGRIDHINLQYTVHTSAVQLFYTGRAVGVGECCTILAEESHNWRVSDFSLYSSPIN